MRQLYFKGLPLPLQRIDTLPPQSLHCCLLTPSPPSAIHAQVNISSHVFMNCAVNFCSGVLELSFFEVLRLESSELWIQEFDPQNTFLWGALKSFGFFSVMVNTGTAFKPYTKSLLWPTLLPPKLDFHYYFYSYWIKVKVNVSQLTTPIPPKLDFQDLRNHSSVSGKRF